MNKESPILVFDRAKLRQQRNRAAKAFSMHDVLFHDAAQHIIERVGDVTRSFGAILDLGSHNGILARHFSEQENSLVVASDCAESMLRLENGLRVVSDEDFLPFASNSFDLVVSNLSLHWINDLPGTLIQIKHALRPDGLFLASVMGGETLHELRQCLLDAELSITGGVSPRVSPTITLQDASGLLQRAGFVLPVVDQETYRLIYPDALALMRDLRGMGAANAHLHRLRHPTRRRVLFEAARLYQQRFADPSGGVHARFDVLFLHGWKPERSPANPY